MHYYTYRIASCFENTGTACWVACLLLRGQASTLHTVYCHWQQVAVCVASCSPCYVLHALATALHTRISYPAAFAGPPRMYIAIVHSCVNILQSVCSVFMWHHALRALVGGVVNRVRSLCRCGWVYLLPAPLCVDVPYNTADTPLTGLTC